jgi:hypothetical protein
VPSRRALIAGLTGIVSVTAGCTDNGELLARCASRGVGSESPHLRGIAPIRGEEQVALGVLVSEQAITEEMYHAARIRDGADELIASVPLMDNREMSSLDPEDDPVFGSDSGELYAVPLGPPPVHGEYTVSVVGPDGEPLATARTRINCYAENGELP